MVKCDTGLENAIITMLWHSLFVILGVGTYMTWRLPPANRQENNCMPSLNKKGHSKDGEVVRS